jgi:hypothetical protein
MLGGPGLVLPELLPCPAPVTNNPPFVRFFKHFGLSHKRFSVDPTSAVPDIEVKINLRVYILRIPLLKPVLSKGLRPEMLI